MATYQGDNLNILQADEDIVRFAFGVALKPGDKVHFIKDKERNPAVTIFLLSLFELRDNDEDHLSVHRLSVQPACDEEIKKKNTLYAVLSVDDVLKIKQEVVELDDALTAEEAVAVLEGASIKYCCLPTDYGSSEENPSHGGIFFYNEFKDSIVSFKDINDGNIPTLNNHPLISWLQNDLLQAVKSFKKFAGKKGEKDVVPSEREELE